MVVAFKFAYYPRTGMVETLLDIFILIESQVKNFSKNKAGYEPPQNVEEVDDANTITVGYN